MSECPYEPCQAVVTLVEQPPYPGTAGAVQMVVRSHNIVHPILAGRCPGSLLRLPLDNEAKTVLAEWRKRDDALIGAAIAREHRQEEARRTQEAQQQRAIEIGPQPRWFGGGRRGTPPRLTEPARLLRGRRRAHEPLVPPAPPANPGAILPGRADFRFPTQLPRRKPGETYPAQHLKVGDMASIEEVQAGLNEANVKLGEALGALSEAKVRLLAAAEAADEAARSMAEVMGQSNAKTVGDSYTATRAAIHEVRSALGTLDNTSSRLGYAQETNENYIGILGS